MENVSGTAENLALVPRMINFSFSKEEVEGPKFAVQDCEKLNDGWTTNEQPSASASSTNSGDDDDDITLENLYIEFEKMSFVLETNSHEMERLREENQLLRDLQGTTEGTEGTEGAVNTSDSVETTQRALHFE